MASEKPYKLVVSSTELINLVKERPCLWNKNLLEYKDKGFREAMWIEIYKEVEPDFDDYKPATRKQIGLQITKKWCNIRDAYVKARNNFRLNKCTKPYIHTKILSFLDPFLAEKSEVTEEKHSDDSGDRWHKETVYIEDEDDEPLVKRQKVEIDKDVLNNQYDSDNVVSMLTKMIHKENDEDRAFFRSIEPSVKDLSADSKLEFRIRVLKLIQDLKMKDKSNKLVKKLNSNDVLT